jgi:hypothetical protein
MADAWNSFMDGEFPIAPSSPEQMTYLVTTFKAKTNEFSAFRQE